MPLQSLYDVPAPAKLNLFLHVVGQRPDGYHLLQSIFVFLDWQDTLHFDLRHDGALSREDLTIALPEHDLCLKAAHALQSASGTPYGAHIFIDKRLPSGAGFGEHLTPIHLASQRFVVIKPPASAQTHHVFKSPLLEIRSKPATMQDFLAQQNAVEWSQNDLQAAAESVCPDVSKALQQLSRRFGHAHMTGSGSATFARLGKKQNCSTSAVNTWLKSLPAGWVGRECVSQGFHPLLGWAPD